MLGCNYEKSRGDSGFSGSEKAVAIALPKKRWNAGLRGFKEHGAPLALNQFKKRLENI